MKKQLRIGADPFPPYQYYDDQKILRGSDFEHIRAAGTAAGFAMEFTIDEWSRVERMFYERQLDAVFQVQKTPEREKHFLFSKLLRNAVTEFITGRADMKADSFEDLAAGACRLGLMQNYAYGEPLDSLNPALKTLYLDQESLLVAIAAKEVDAGVFDQGVKDFLMEKLGISTVYTLAALSFLRPLYMAFHDSEIRDAFDRFL
ncbi:MAG: transporter substrate-binding domain-containing protein [Treponema sp.]|nr:transporter substrate-binding domain-containing protein [Treponema sp.]